MWPAVTTLAFVSPGTVYFDHKGSIKARNLGSCNPAHLDWSGMEYEDASSAFSLFSLLSSFLVGTFYVVT